MNLYNPFDIVPSRGRHLRKRTELRAQEVTSQSFFSLSRKSSVFNSFLEFATKHASVSRSRHLTDLIAVFFLGTHKRYLEIGASHPENCSDTFLLEKNFSWNGLQVEPNPEMARKLRQERFSDLLEVAIVESRLKKQVLLNEEKGNLSRFIGKKVTSIDLGQLLDLKGTSFDALFMDIEGGELAVLNHKRFKELRFEFLSIERIWNSERINAILESLGYVNFWSKISGYESWWLRNPHNVELVEGVDY